MDLQASEPQDPNDFKPREVAMAHDLSLRVSSLLDQVDAVMDPANRNSTRSKYDFALGMLAAARIITSIQIPDPAPPEKFADEKAAEGGIGIEAMKILRMLTQASTDEDIARATTQAQKLIQVWEVNSRSEAIKTALPAENLNRLVLTCGRSIFEAKSMLELFALRVVSVAINDNPPEYFNCLVIVQAQPMILAAEFVAQTMVEGKAKEEVRRYNIGTIDKIPGWMKTLRIVK